MFSTLLLTLILAFADAFPECRVMGSIYVMPDEPPAFQRLDRCPIEDQIEKHRLLLMSQHWIVEVPLPANTGGHSPFSYLWGSQTAQIQTTRYPVAWSRILRG